MYNCLLYYHPESDKRYAIVEPSKMDVPFTEKVRERMRDPRKGIGADIVLTIDELERKPLEGKYRFILIGELCTSITKEERPLEGKDLKKRHRYLHTLLKKR